MSYIVLADARRFQFVCRRGVGKNHVAPKGRIAICGSLVTYHNDVLRLANYSLLEETVCKRCVPIGRKRGIIEEVARDAAGKVR